MISDADRQWLLERGSNPEVVREQIAQLLGDASPASLVRPAILSDGVRGLTDDDAGVFEAAHARAATEGRVMSWVPASGAASRMCCDLLAAWHGAPPTPTTRTLLEHLDDLALWPTAERAGAQIGDDGSMLDAMFGPAGMGLDQLPKALVPFHASLDGPRTAFDEHLVEARRLGQDGDGNVRAHFTISEAHRQRFEDALQRNCVALMQSATTSKPATYDVDFSVQSPATDMPALWLDGTLARTGDGRPLMRAGGHGALLTNLQDCGGDVVLVKNIDNVVPEDLRGPNLLWRARLAGLLVKLQGRAWELVRELRKGTSHTADASAFVRGALGIELADEPDVLLNRLHRPWRVCGMVKNTGQPGGGPFWVRGEADEVTLQIVESAQLERGNPEQVAIWEQGTHFNPVDMALGLRDVDGRAFELHRFVDPTATLRSQKSFEGRPLQAIEHPGLWNGGMAGWNSVFVEIPADTFQPVKTLADLLRCEHGGPLC